MVEEEIRKRTGRRKQKRLKAARRQRSLFTGGVGVVGQQHRLQIIITVNKGERRKHERRLRQSPRLVVCNLGQGDEKLSLRSAS